MWSLYIHLSKLLKLEEGREDRLGNDRLQVTNYSSLKISKIVGLNHDVILPPSHFIEVPLVNQVYDWDCGLACILMVLQAIGVEGYDLPALGKLCKVRSIWTVDLAYLLQKFSISFSYFTVTLGANPDFSVETYYRDQLPHDSVRVDLLFQEAVKAGIKIVRRSISQQEISLLILSGKYIAVALVDQLRLRPENSCVRDVSGSYLGYTGHYIVICGYDAESNEFEIRDPASSRKHERVSSKCLDEARKSFGTDEDILLISIDQKPVAGKTTQSSACQVQH